jgi:hypothetical protein
MKRAVGILVGIAIFVAAGWPVSAQDQSRRALAEELMKVVHVKENAEKTFAMFKTMVEVQVEKMKLAAGPAAKAAEASGRIDKMMDLVKQEFGWEKIKDDYITLYAKTFTESELKDLIAFYKTATGQAFVEKQPELMKQSIELTQKRVKDVMPKLQAMAKEIEESFRAAQPAQPRTK